METIVDLLEDAAARFGRRNALGLRTDDGTTWHWTYAEVLRRSRIAAWRLRALGLEPGRSRPDVVARRRPRCPPRTSARCTRGLVFVPLDPGWRRTRSTGIVDASGAVRLLLGSGRDAPDPREVGLERFPTSIVEDLSADPDDTFPPDWEAQLAAWPRPKPADIFELVFTSGTTGNPKGVILDPRQRARRVDVVPRDHQPDGAPDRVAAARCPTRSSRRSSLYYALNVGADILYVRSRNPRVIFDSLREHRVTSMVARPAGARPVLERDRARGREAGPDGDVRSAARHRPASAVRGPAAPVPERPRAVRRRPPPVRDRRRLPAARAPAGVGGHGRHRHPGVRRDRDLRGRGDDDERPPAGLRGLAAQARRDADRRGRRDPVPRAEPLSRLLGRPRGDRRGVHRGRLVQVGRPRRISTTRAGSSCTGARRTSSCCPTGSTCSPRTSRTRCGWPGSATRWRSRRSRGGSRRSCCRRGPTRCRATRGRRRRSRAQEPEDVRREIDAAVKAANRSLGPNQRIAGWRVWPEADFPRTHTFKVKRDRVRAWAAINEPLPVVDEA